MRFFKKINKNGFSFRLQPLLEQSESIFTRTSRLSNTHQLKELLSFSRYTDISQLTGYLAMRRINIYFDKDVWDCLDLVSKQLKEDGKKPSKSDLIRRAVRDTYICQKITSKKENTGK